MYKFLRFAMLFALPGGVLPPAGFCAGGLNGTSDLPDPKKDHGAEITVSTPAVVTPDAYGLYLDGVLKETEGKYDEALALYGRALEFDPKATEIYRDAIKCAMRTNKIDLARQYVDRLLTLQPEKADNLALSGMVNWGQGRIPEAVADYEKALKLDPDNGDALYQLSLLLRESEPRRSLEYLAKYAEVNEQERPRIYYEIAVMKLKEQDTDGALDYFGKAAAMSPDFLQPRYAMGQLYEMRRDTEAAVSVYREILKADPKNPSLNGRLGELMLSMERVPEAEAYFRRAAELEPDNAPANYWLAAIAEERKDYAAAAEYLGKSSAYATSPVLVLRRSLYLTQSHRMQEAADALAAAYAKWPQEHDIGYFYALGLADMKQYDKAFDVLGGIVRAAPDNMDALTQYGIVAERLNKIDIMEQSFDTVLSTRPADAMVLNYMGYALADRGLKLDKARDCITRALAADPDNGAYQDSMGWVLYKLGNYADALSNIRKAAGNSPYDAEIWQHLGAVYSVLGSTEAAWLSYRTAFMLEPETPGLSDKAAHVFGSVPKAGRGGLYLKYLAQAQGSYEKYSALCNVTLESAGSSAEFKGIIDFNPATGVSLSLTGPMFTPVWKAEISTAGVFRHDLAETMGVESEKLDAISRDMLRILSDYYTGAMFRAGTEADFSSGWGGGSVETGKYKLGLSKQGDSLDAVKFSDGGEISLALGGYGRFGLHMVPKSLEFKRMGFKVVINVIKDNPSFSGNSGLIPD